MLMIPRPERPSSVISVLEAERQILASIPANEAERLAVDKAVGRVLAQDVVADRDGPPFDRITLDGYAISSLSGSGPWKVETFQPAGFQPVSLQSPNGAIETATGASLPLGCDSLVPYEDCQRDGDQVRLLQGAPPPQPERGVHRRGSDYRYNSTRLTAGWVLRAPDFHSLATHGLEFVSVRRRARWALITTGDEVVAPGEIPLAWQIRASNALAIKAEANAWGFDPDHCAHWSDDPDHVAAGLAALPGDLDALILCGGVSSGRKDLIPQGLVDAGYSKAFHRVAQRPGKPLWFGLAARSGGRPRVAFGLPGNPVSSLVSFRRYVIPWLLSFEGRPSSRRTWTGVLDDSSLDENLTQFLPWSRSRGVLPRTNSGNFDGWANTDGFVEIPPGARNDRGPGDWDIYPWGGIF